MSDQAWVKKECEWEAVGYFLEAYRSATGESLFVWSSERPDFIGLREDGTPVGIELTAIRWDPEMRLAGQILRHGEQMSAWDALDKIGAALEEKSAKLRTPGWQLPDATILVLMLEDARLDDTYWVFDQTLSQEWSSYGFSEVWVADYSELDAFRDVELLGLHPPARWAYHRRVLRKPFG